MGLVSILFVITAAWFIYHFVVAYRSNEIDKEKTLRKLSYGKTLGLFTLIVAIMGQMVGLIAMFHAIEEVVANGEAIKPVLVFGRIKVTMIVTIYGLIIYLFSIFMWFVSTTIIEKR